MPKREHLVLCGGVQERSASGRHVVRLNLHGSTANVRLRISDIAQKLLVSVPDRLLDLIEIATYVYAADGAISRGGPTDREMGAHWRRSLVFRIPVRQPELWGSEPLSSGLAETLSFLSDEQYAFEFVALNDPPPLAAYLEFTPTGETTFSPDEVILFSGGLDSFSGAVEEVIGRRNKVVLVSHRSDPKVAEARKQLVEGLRKRAGYDRVLHVPVLATLTGKLNVEPTHRTRSFLFAALGAAIGRLFGLDRLRFFENGVVSLNLPPVEQVVGVRATRTTHPQALAGFRRILAAALGVPIDVSNPFLWLTKAEVIRQIAGHECADLIRYTRSCTRVRDMTILHPHCGKCSQCIDRRFSILAAGQAADDPADAYNVELFTGERPPGPDREMALAYVRSASKVARMDDEAFFAEFGEVSRFVGYFPEPADLVATQVLNLHRRHASTVCRIFDDAISQHASALREGSLPECCLLVLKLSRDDRARVEPQLSRAAQLTIPPTPEIRIAIDADRRRVVFDGWGELTGAGAELIIALAGPFGPAEGARAGTLPIHKK